MTLGQKIKKLRNSKNLTQKDLADQIHVTFQTVSKWESDTNEPDVATLRELAKIFNCSVDYLISVSDEEIEEEPHNEEVNIVPAAIVTPEEQVEETTPPSALHRCAKCGKPIPVNDLASEDIINKERHGRHVKSVVVGKSFYHKECLEKVKKDRSIKEAKEKKEKVSSDAIKCFGWSIALGVVGLGVSLAIFLYNTKYVNPGLGVLYSILIGYALFAMLYCILSGSYIGDVFIWCSSLSIKFPGLIFSWDLDGFIWVIGMKILFAVIGFLVGILALLFAIAFSSLLGSISFPFVLIHNIRTDYEDALF